MSVVLPKDPHAPILLVDAGYAMFYRLTATDRYLKNQPPEKAPVDEAAHTALLVGHLHGQLAKFLKKFGVEKGHVYTLRDCSQCENWRLALHGTYKGTRKQATTFIRAFADVFEETMQGYGPTLRLPRLEADDLVALTVKRIRALRPEQPLIILANDRDYLQLHKFGHVRIIDGTLKEIQPSEPGPEGATIELWKKILMGDVSDNIPPVAKGVGPKTALKLAKDEAARDAFVQAKGCADQLAHNRALIDFEAIPESLVAAFDAARQYVV